MPTADPLAAAQNARRADFARLRKPVYPVFLRNASTRSPAPPRTPNTENPAAPSPRGRRKSKTVFSVNHPVARTCRKPAYAGATG